MVSPRRPSSALPVPELDGLGFVEPSHRGGCRRSRTGSSRSVPTRPVTYRRRWTRCPVSRPGREAAAAASAAGPPLGLWRRRPSLTWFLTSPSGPGALSLRAVQLCWCDAGEPTKAWIAERAVPLVRLAQQPVALGRVVPGIPESALRTSPTDSWSRCPATAAVHQPARLVQPRRRLVQVDLPAVGVAVRHAELEIFHAAR